MWVLGALDEVASDFSVFHRIGDIGSLPAATFARLAPLLPVYQGALTAAIAAAQEEGQGEDTSLIARPPVVPPAPPRGLENLKFEYAAGESFESRLARATPIPAGQGAKASEQITALVAQG